MENKKMLFVFVTVLNISIQFKFYVNLRKQNEKSA